MHFRQFFVNLPKIFGLSSRIALLLAFFTINRQNSKSVRRLGLANYRIVSGGSVVLKVHSRYTLYTILCEFAEKIWSQLEDTLFFAHFPPQIAKTRMQSGDWAWPRIGSFPVDREYSMYSRDMPSTKFYVYLPKIFGLNSRTAFLSYKVQSKLSISLQAYVQILDQYN